MICNNLDGMGFAHLFVPLGAYSDTTAQVPANAMKRPKSGYPTTEEADLHSSKPLWIQSQPSKSGSYPMIFKHISILTGWAHSLAERHVNCRRIPVDLVLRMCIRMLRFLKRVNTSIETVTLATTFWVALKFYSSRDTIPNASFMVTVTGIDKQTLIESEPRILAKLDWDLYAFYKAC
ncbi:hypothetical protein PSENEW3_00002625 [Picochlorum sp. SENEW3]|nr:hypothetical protein PSENEW3_00002625 [Picochlorum sp. SENEW3]